MKKLEKEINKSYKYTDTRVGTDSVRAFSAGNTLPLVGYPHGANYFAVQTNSAEEDWWFNPNDCTFEGFRLTHQPSPWMGDFSHLTILPFTESKDVKFDTKGSTFNQAFNIIKYKDGSKAKLTANIYSAAISFKADNNAKFNLRAEGLKLTENDGIIEGTVINYADCEDKDFTMHMVISLDADFILKEKKDSYNIITDKTDVNLYISTSFISLDQAKLNHERLDKDYDKILAETKASWGEILDKFDIKITEVDPIYEKYNPYDKKEQRDFFFHCLYRASMFPMRFYEVDKDGIEIHYNTLKKSIETGKLFTNIGFWDGQKTLFPLLTLIDVPFIEDLLEGIVNTYKDTGYLPKWLSPDERSLMPGTLVDNFIADSLSKGIGMGFGEILLDAMIKSASPSEDESKYGRYGAQIMDEIGYIPADLHESVNQTLDNSLSDYSIAKVAEILGKHDIAREYYDKSKAYLNLFDPETGWFRAKDRDGNFTADFDPYDWGSPYTEGSAFQNSFNAYHDIVGIIDAFGSKKAFESKLDQIANSPSNFKVGAYGEVIHEMREVEVAHFGQIGISNQPSFHLPYLYNYVERPDKTQSLVKELMLNYFSYDFTGYPGDEDNGSLSSWFILSSLGIYPVAPGSGKYELGIPFFDEIEIKLSNGNKLTIKTKENFHQKKFVKEMLVDGNIYGCNAISHHELIHANEIVYTLGLVPERSIS